MLSMIPVYAYAVYDPRVVFQSRTPSMILVYAYAVYDPRVVFQSHTLCMILGSFIFQSCTPCMILGSFIFQSCTPCMILRSFVFQSHTLCMILRSFVFQSRSPCMILRSFVFQSLTPCMILGLFVFQSRTPCMILVNVNGQDLEYELLCILDFNNIRKRMSVIVRRNNKISLYCKGADSTVYERLDKVANSDMMELTLSHLNVSAIRVVFLFSLHTHVHVTNTV